MLMVFLNKKDILERKVLKVSFKVNFPEFDGDDKNTQEVIEFTKSKLEEVGGNARPVYFHVTCATDKKNVEFVFDAVQDSIIYSSMRNIGLQ